MLAPTLCGQCLGGGAEVGGATHNQTGKLKPKTRSSPYRAIHLNDAVVLMHNAITDGKPEPCAFFGAFRREEGIVNARQIFRRNALPRIRHFDYREARFGA